MGRVRPRQQKQRSRRMNQQIKPPEGHFVQTNHISWALAVTLTTVGAVSFQGEQAFSQNVNQWITGLPRPLATDVVQNAREAASAGLDKFRPAVAAAIADRNLGFKDTAELASATVGDPFPLAFVPNGLLAAYTTNQSPTSIVQWGGGVMVPVKVGDAVRCMVMLSSDGTNFTAVGLGQPNTAERIAHYMQVVAESNRIPQRSLVVVSIPTMFQTFIARTEDGQMWLTPVSDAPAYNLTAGHELSAKDVFAELQPAAQSYHPSSFVAHTNTVQ
jgi:hypothetical protein